ncbi:MAG: hypothetical protein RBG13Loki_1148 [Promethearchaeota archaeon CR_4]|nr:MAG: hypothetical protein RBG13Loki_1148 [Candidatus Lokiarchaeota archaeon CR_4]
MSKKAPKPEQKKTAETPNEQPTERQQPTRESSNVRIFVALCR